ncbi:putative 16S rRNA (guanine(527)-N(7))-methyltransferase [Rosa chinensis]|uniref:Putative 16S rRNA (Guanine(527)-N(7))-methyltransferase n=1 Tax=Rosa chinensis TaxID=74649 RepID=A0A2P6P275_ROSCH|nr:ribosomal RNA small subunit methyltransferase G [Rosa chinensis]PRQ16020.1 putative 16S rRNA (guanine(527)-N(7))-methyltransferase [Rosa chinensis]
MLLLVSRCALVPFSLGTFFKHLPRPKPSPIFPSTITPKTLTTATIHCSSHFEALDSRQKHQIHLYVDTLLEWNQRMNLTAVREEGEVMERHIEDSLAIIPPITDSYLSHCGASCGNVSVVDVGSGAGLPGLVLAIACPEWKVTLMESMNKRCVFLEHAVNHVGLSNVEIVRGRAENLGQDVCFREKYDVAVARAVAEMRILAEYCLPLVRVGGLFVAAKGHDPQMEIRNAEKAIQILGASISQLCPVESHSPYGQRTAIVCLKTSPTPKKYPRDPGTPVKVPL